MPELPDVEGFRRVFCEHADGRRVRRVRVRDPQVVHGVSGRTFDRAVRGKSFSKPRRHGKWLIAGLSGSDTAILMHFGMTGSLRWAGQGKRTTATTASASFWTMVNCGIGTCAS